MPRSVLLLHAFVSSTPSTRSLQCSVFYYSSAAHLDPPSFPTRRSSDLLTPRAAVGSSRSRSRLPPAKARAIATPRSEEHTSELQSRGHLVCRLLLEKKKT